MREIALAARRLIVFVLENPVPAVGCLWFVANRSVDSDFSFHSEFD